MALLQKLKELLGIGGGDERPARRDTEVTVERDPDAEPEPEPEGEPEPELESVPEEGTITAEESAEQATRQEEGSEAGTEDVGAHVDDGTETEEVETVTDEESVEEAGEESVEEAEEESVEGTTGETVEGAAEEAESVVDIKGIGPTYAERLEAVGITTVAELATADAESVAEGAKVGEGRARNWIERARNR